MPLRAALLLVFLLISVSPAPYAQTGKVGGNPPDSHPQSKASQPESRQDTTENSSFVVNMENSKLTPNDTADSQRKEHVESTRKNAEIIFTAVIAVATIAQAIIYWCQSGLMRRALSVNENTLILTQRPKVIARTFFFSESGGTMPRGDGVAWGSYAKGQFYVENTGGTKATVEEIWSEVFIAKVLPGQRPYEGKDGSKGTLLLAPGKHTYYLFSRKEPLEESTVSNIKSGSEFLYVLGWLGYRDELGIYRKTRFCRQYIPDRDRFVPVENDPDYESAD
jgi:hypothetical protein